MKKQLLLFCAILLSVPVAYISAQDCTGGRYQTPLFSVDSIMNVPYGANLQVNGIDSIELVLDIYFPDGDTDTDRPLIIMAHGGSFVGGDKSSMEAECKAFASLGYVTATIKYRLLDQATAFAAFINGTIGIEFKKEVVRAMHDMKAAVRFFRKSVVEDGNPYGINPDIIITGGVSAGGILSDHVTYMNKQSEIPSDLTTYVADQGGLEGNSGNSGYSSTPQMSISWCGAILDTSWIEAGDQPFVGVHNEGDIVVPNLEGEPDIGMPVPVTLQGDSLIYQRTLNVGIPSAYMMAPGTGHCDFPPEAAIFVSDFVHDQLCEESLGLDKNTNIIEISVYPNPVNESLTIEIPSNQWNWNLSISDALGKEVYSNHIGENQNQFVINSTKFAAGTYSIKLLSKEGKMAIKKVVVQ